MGLKMVAISNHRAARGGPVKVLHGANDGFFNLAGASVACVRASLADAFNIHDEANAFVNGDDARSDYRLRANDFLEFIFQRGRKGGIEDAEVETSRLMTVKEAAAEMHCSISFIYKAMAAGQLSYERRGRRKLPLAVSVAEYRQRTRYSATNQPSSSKRSPKRPYQYQRLFCDKSSGAGK